MQQHIDAAQIVGCGVAFLPQEFLHILYAQQLGKLQQQRARTTHRVAQAVTMDTCPQCGVGPSDSANTGYKLGFITGAAAWGSGCRTFVSRVLRYPGWLP